MESNVNSFVRSLRHPPAAALVGVGIVLTIVGWPILGIPLAGIGAGWAFARSQGPQALLGEALRGVSIVMDDPLRARLESLPTSLKRARSIAGAEQLGMQAYEQLMAMCKRFIGLRKLLGERFSPSEMTYGRYLSASEQVFLAGLDDLQRCATRLESLASVDVERLKAQRRMLERQETKEELSEGQARELETLRERMSLHEDESNNLSGLLANNEQSLTQMSNAQSALGRIDTSRGLAKLDSSDAMAELEALSERAEQYAVGKKD
jgi:hypothetical protein